MKPLRAALNLGEKNENLSLDADVLHKGRDTLGDKSLRHVAGTCCRNNSPRVTRLIFMKIIVAAAEFCRRDLSHEFKPV